jgi:hypothetical protein
MADTGTAWRSLLEQASQDSPNKRTFPTLSSYAPLFRKLGHNISGKIHNGNLEVQTSPFLAEAKP